MNNINKMGRIKTTLVKRSGKKLLTNFTESFSTDFEKNKKAVSEKADITSKKLRNGIAGYITRMVSKQQNKQ